VTTQEDPNNPFQVHCYHGANGLAAVAVADKEYPQRVVYGLLNKTMEDVSRTAVGSNPSAVSRDSDEELPSMKKDLIEFQDPKQSDKLTKIQASLEEVKGVMANNIENLLARGEKLDDLMAKSEDLSGASVQFYKQAKKANSCCKY